MTTVHPEFSVRSEFFIPIFSAIAGSMSIAVLSSWLGTSSPTAGLSRIWSSPESFIYATLLTLIGVSLMTAFYELSMRQRRLAAKVLMVGMFAPAQVLFTIIISQILILAILSQLTHVAYVFMILFSLYGALFFAIGFLTDAIPRTLRNSFLTFYAAAVGAILGISIGTAAFLSIILILAVYDWILVRRFSVGRSATEVARHRPIPLSLSYVGNRVEIGLGEFVISAAIPAHTYAHAGGIPSIISVGLILAGSYLTLKSSLKSGLASGLIIPVLLGSLPIAVSFIVNFM